MIRRLFAILCCAGLLTPDVHAVTVADFDQAVSQLNADTTLFSQWMSDQFKNAIPFNSTSGNVVPSQLKLFGFEIGAEILASGTKLDTDALRNLNTTLLDTQAIDTQSRFPMPMVLAHAKVGLPMGFDAGIRLGGIPKTDIDKGDTKGSVKNKVVGIDIRKKIIEEGAVKPFGLTLGLNYTRADGSIDVDTKVDSLTSAQITNGGQTFNANFAEGTSHQHMDWKTNSYGVQAIMDKQILFFTPYVGASANYNTGNINNSISATTTATLTQVGNLANTDSQSITSSGSSSAKANKWDVRALLGAEFSILPFMNLGINGEYAGSKNMAGGLGLRFQFR